MVEAHAEAIMGRMIYHDRYQESRLSSMDFWQTLSVGEKLGIALKVNAIAECILKHKRAAWNPVDEEDWKHRNEERTVFATLLKAGGRLTLVEVNFRQMAEVFGRGGYCRVTEGEAYEWVKEGHLHETGLFVDDEGIVRYYAQGDC